MSAANPKRYAQIIRLRPEAEAEYRRIHQEVWPEVLAMIEKCHMRNYSIFLRDGLLFAYYEYVGTDHDADMARMAEDPHTQRWWKITDPMQAKVESAGEDEWWGRADEVFHTD
ncbi:L-rhamnose 1-epimerase [Mangrovactinospora gilvigrisea]|uniref:L-rhamnose 1-epimerase n=1 Tax=Mangrovactinospora gilvigrisea TaxID=1428644 RepID=A0A1J7BCV0_9ACTN|nr:L-rhamnose mutarotase [Mangrovactinospora gilvigrisea]OIV36421.1 L-rhamnose 1-epimerase [Mangrovactinospora gilvigrisea]